VRKIMHPFYEQFLDRLRLVHDEIGAAVEGLRLEALDWTPGAGMNSLGVLVVHVAGSEKHWFGDIIAGQPSGRDREAEFRSRGVEAAVLTKRLDESLSYAREVVGRLGIDDLTAERAASGYRGERTMSVGSCLLHILRHAAEHAGHMQLTRQLWEAGHEP
jgi:uncharacterized damage-inducible protein DinB